MRFSMKIIFPNSVDEERQKQILQSPKFLNWKSNQEKSFDYHSITITSVTWFGSNAGFIELTTDVTFNGVRSNKVVYLRGNSVAILVKIQSKETGIM